MGVPASRLAGPRARGRPARAGSVGSRAEPRLGVARGEPPREELPSVLGDERLAVVDDAVDGGLPRCAVCTPRSAPRRRGGGRARGRRTSSRTRRSRASARGRRPPRRREPGEADRVPGEPLGGDALDVPASASIPVSKGANVSVWTTSSRSSPTSATSIRPSKARASRRRGAGGRARRGSRSGGAPRRLASSSRSSARSYFGSNPDSACLITPTRVSGRRCRTPEKWSRTRSSARSSAPTAAARARRTRTGRRRARGPWRRPRLRFVLRAHVRRVPRLGVVRRHRRRDRAARIVVVPVDDPRVGPSLTARSPRRAVRRGVGVTAACHRAIGGWPVGRFKGYFRQQ